MKKINFSILVLAILLVVCRSASGQTVTVSDTVYTPTGAKANGTLTITSPVAFTSYQGIFVPANTSTTVNISNGALTVILIPNIGSNPLGSYYTATYSLDNSSSYSETWIIPQTPSTVNLLAIRSQVLPPLSATLSFSQMNSPMGCLSLQVPQFLNPGWGCTSLPSAGTISLSSQTSNFHTFTTPYSATPICNITPTSNPSSIGFYWVSATASAVTANVSISGTITFNFSCTAQSN